MYFAGEEFVCMNRGGAGCSSSAVFISLSEETAELVLRWKANGMQMHSIIKQLVLTCSGVISCLAQPQSPH